MQTQINRFFKKVSKNIISFTKVTIVEFFIFFQNEEIKCNQNHINYLKYTKCQYLTGPNIKIQQ